MAASVCGPCLRLGDTGRNPLATASPRETVPPSNVFLAAYKGQCCLFNYCGYIKAPFLRNIYQLLGVSYDCHRVLYNEIEGAITHRGGYYHDSTHLYHQQQLQLR
jgi:hypothetical protein